MAAQNRAGLVASIRALLRQANLKPFTDDDIIRVLEFAIDDLSNRLPFSVAISRTNSIKDQMEYILPSDTLSVLEIYYMDAAGATLKTAITSTTSPPLISDQIEVNEDITDFPTSGTLKIDDEELSYTAKDLPNKKFTGITRGVNSTTAATHALNAGVIEAGKSWTLLTPTTTRALAADDADWFNADSSVPEEYYLFNGIFGFSLPPSKTGYRNVIMREMISPPSLSSDISVVEGLLMSFNKAVIHYTAGELAITLAQDDASLNQANIWLRMYKEDVQLMDKTMYQRERGSMVMIPYTGRSL